MDRYPSAKRSVDARADHITEADRELSRQFGKDYFDGDRKHGYGGYSYHPRFWTDTVARFRDYYKLVADARILDVGCGKGFMLVDFQKLMPEATLAGVDISTYAIENAHRSVKDALQVGNARQLPFEDNSFDLVTGINTLHNLPEAECRQAVREIQRVSRGNAFIMVDAWRSEEGKRRLQQWVLTAKTYMSVTDWMQLFQEEGYTGDCWWFHMEPEQEAKKVG